METGYIVPSQGLRQALQKALAVIGITSVVAACASNPDANPYAEYEQMAPAGVFQPISELPQLQGFVELLGPFEKEALASRLDDVYAEEFYLNDTFHTFHQREVLQQYFLDLADIAETEVVFLDGVVMGTDALVRWQMNTHSKVLWKTLDIHSIGMTHLRFNEQGKIILHQDFWDSTRGFYEHIPMIGGVLRWIRGGMAPDE